MKISLISLCSKFVLSITFFIIFVHTHISFPYRDGAASESEMEDDEQSQVVLPQTLKRKGNLEDNKSAVRLHEIGPRLTMQLMKIEEGLLTGEVLYHDHIVKTEEEKEALRKMVEKKRKLKEYRKKVQEENRARNIRTKEEATGKHKKPKLEAAAIGDEAKEDSEPENDAAYYKAEVGEEPDEGEHKVIKVFKKILKEI